MKQLVCSLGWVFALLCVPSWGIKVPFHSRINGYPVIFIDTEFGNFIQFGTSVPAGMGHDDPIVMTGAAHLLEHEVFRRTDLFEDGEREVAKVNRQTGGGYNAFTGDEKTAYYMNGHPDGLGIIIRHIGAMMSGWRPEAEGFRNERSVVIEESGQYHKQDAVVAQEIYRTELLPRDHWLRKYSIGLKGQLSKIEMGMLQNQYYANYQPDNVTIFSIGNFSAMTRSQVGQIKALIGRSFHAPKDSRPAKDPHEVLPASKVKFPPLIPANAEEGYRRVVEVGSKSSVRMLHVTFELPEGLTGLEVDALEMFCDGFLLNLPGGFMDALKKRGWIDGIHASRTVMNNLKLLDFSFVLRPEGYAHRYEIVNELLALSGKFSREGIPYFLFSLLRKKEIANYSQMLTNPQQMFNDAVENTWRLGGDADAVESYFNFNGRFSAVSRKRQLGSGA